MPQEETAVVTTLVQKLDEFMRGQLEYRRDRQTVDAIYQSGVAAINARLVAIEVKLAGLPCDSHKALSDQEHVNIRKETVASFATVEKDSAKQWQMIGVIWAAIGAACVTILTAWVNTRK